MKRDLDRARRILLAIESSDADPREVIAPDAVSEYSDTVVSENVRLLHEAGLIEAANFQALGPDGYQWKPKRLTWDGHDFLDSARNEEIWNKARDCVKQPVGGVGFGPFRDLLSRLARQAVGLGE